MLITTRTNFTIVATYPWINDSFITQTYISSLWPHCNNFTKNFMSQSEWLRQRYWQFVASAQIKCTRVNMHIRVTYTASYGFNNYFSASWFRCWRLYLYKWFSRLWS